MIPSPLRGLRRRLREIADTFGQLAALYRGVPRPVAWARERREAREAAIHRLQHELAIARLDLKDVYAALKKARRELEELRAERDEARAEVERLRGVGNRLSNFAYNYGQEAGPTAIDAHAKKGLWRMAKEWDACSLPKRVNAAKAAALRGSERG